MNRKDFLSVTEASKLLGISRTAVLKKIYAGKINAQRIGNLFAIPKSEFGGITEGKISESQKKVLAEGVKRTVKEYSETLEKLGKE